MLNLRKIAVTGAPASGKSSVCQILKKHGAFVVNSDDIAHQLLSPRTDLGQKILALLGSDVVENEQFSRKKIAETVFNDAKKLEALEKLLHPIIIKTISQLYEEVKSSNNASFFVVEMPLLFEIKNEGFYDTVICVNADESSCCKRFVQSGFSNEDFAKRAARQLTSKEKCRRSDIVIENNGSVRELEKQIEKLIEKLR